ncbi:MAG: polysaccharide export protein [Lachnospiraceae bacterium]|nr:polysaccharide export protein [Lachnospiraceae bacterium]
METEEIEIDLLQLWNAVRHRIWLVLLAGFIVADIAFAFTKFLITPMYSSSATMLVVTKETTLSSLADLQLGSQLTNDYEILISSRPVLQQTVEELNLDISYKRLRSMITISNPNDSRMLIISTMQPDPELAKSVVDTVAQISSEYIAEKMEVTAPKIIEEGEVPINQSSPSLLRNTAIGGMLGILAAVFLICVAVILNDSIQTEDDIERYLQLPVLAVVPDKSGSSRKSAGRKKSANQKRAAS